MLMWMPLSSFSLFVWIPAWSCRQAWHVGASYYEFWWIQDVPASRLLPCWRSQSMLSTYFPKVHVLCYTFCQLNSTISPSQILNCLTAIWVKPSRNTKPTSDSRVHIPLPIIVSQRHYSSWHHNQHQFLRYWTSSTRRAYLALRFPPLVDRTFLYTILLSMCFCCLKPGKTLYFSFTRFKDVHFY